MKKTFGRKHFAAFSLFSLAFFCNAESFRTSKLHYLSLQSESGSEVQELLGTNESLAIKLPEDKTFLEGLEIKVDIPESIAYWQDCVACSVYNKITPDPNPANIDYSGSRQFVSTLPGKLSWVLQIPLKKENSFKQNQYTSMMDNVFLPTNDIVFIRLQPVMKGVPEETLNSKIKFNVKPLLSDKGALIIKLLHQDSEEKAENSTIYIDENIVSLPKEGRIFLDKGVHNISVVSSAYRNESRTVRIDQAKTTEIQIELKSISPSVFITAPEGSRVFLDDKAFTDLGKETYISEGEHKIRFLIGDYEIVRSISAINGKTYKANCSVSLEIEEE